MRKKNSYNYATVKSLFDPELEGVEGVSYFRVNGGMDPTTIKVSPSLMHRLFRLGQAYGIRQLKYLGPDVKIIIGSVEMPEFLRDLKKLLTLVNDEVLHDKVNELVAAIVGSPGGASTSVSVSTGDFSGGWA